MKKSLALIFAVFGPGLITAVADNDASGVATYTVAASLYGMASQYLVIPTTLLLGLTQEIGARISLVTGKGLGSLIRERCGIKTAIIIFLLYFLVNEGVTLQNVAGLKAAFQLFQFPSWHIGVLLTSVLLIFLIIKLNFKNLQRLFLLMILFYIAYIISAFLVHPNWPEAARESFVFPQKINFFNISYWFSLIAVLGTTITAWGQFFISSYIVDKGLTKENLLLNKIEVYSGAFVTNFLSWMMAIAVTYTLFINGISVIDGYTAALAIKPLAGEFSATLFAIGLFGASILGLSIVPLATAYVFTEMFGFERTLNTNFDKGRIFYIIYIIQVVAALLIILFPHINLFRITLYANYVNGAVLPIIFYFLIKFSEDKELMGEYASGRLVKFFIRIAMFVILLGVVATIAGNFISSS